MSPWMESGRRALLLSRSPKRRRPAHHWSRPPGLSRPARAHLGLQLLDLVLELADVLRRVRVVQLALDAALLSLRAGRASQHGVRSPSQSAARPALASPLTWISSSAMRCRISATAAMLSASRRRTAITSSLLWGRGWGKRGHGARQGLGDRGSGGAGTLHSASACLRRLSLSCVCSPLFCAARYCSFSCSAARSASTRFSRLRWMWSWGRMGGGQGLAEGPTPGAGFPPWAGLGPPASRAPLRAAAALDPRPAPGPLAAARSSARPAARPGPASAGTPSSGHRGTGGPAGRGRRSACARGPRPLRPPGTRPALTCQVSESSCSCSFSSRAEATASPSRTLSAFSSS